MKRVMSAATAVLLCACATMGGGGQQKDSIKTEQQKLTNAYVYFDVANCAPKAPAVPERVTNEALLGVIVSARPLVSECLIDPKNRGKEKVTQVTVNSTLAEAGVEHKVTGTNLTDAGVACISTALKKYTDGIPNLDAKHSANLPPPAPAAPAPPTPPAKGKGKPAKAPPPPPPPPAAPPAPPPAPITAQMQFQHDSSADPSVAFDVNEGSDVLGQIRMAVPTWCDCYAEWTGAPASFNGSLKVSKPAPAAGDKAAAEKKDAAAAATPELVSPTEVKIDPVNDPASDKVGACIQGKIAAMKFKPPSSDYIVLPFHGLFVNSNTTQPLINATPDLQFTQFDLLRGQRAATAAIAVGARSQAVTSYDAAVKHFKSVPDNKKTFTMIDDLKAKCKALLEADDRVISALSAQQEVEEATHAFAEAQKAKDPAWAKAEEATAKQVAAAQKDVQSYKDARKSDEGACPKSK